MKTASYSGKAATGPRRADAQRIGMLRWTAAFSLLVAGFAGAEAVIYLQPVETVPARVLVIAPRDEAGDAAGDLDRSVARTIEVLKSSAALASATKSLDLAFQPGFAGTSPEVQLQASLDIHREGTAPVVSIAMKGAEAETGTRVANYLANVLTSGAKIAPVKAEAVTNDALAAARAELAAFEAGDGRRMADVQAEIGATGEALRQTGLRYEEARRMASASARATVADVLSGKLPAEMTTPRLQSLLARYPQARATFDGLSQKLGNLHPELQAAKAELDRISTAIGNELRAASAAAARNLRDIEAERSKQETTLAAAKAELAALSSKHAQLARNAGDASGIGTTAEADEQGLPAGVLYRTISSAGTTAIDATTAWLYRAEGTILGLIAAATVLLGGRRRQAVRRPIPATTSAAPAPKAQPRGILEQIAMLEEMWPQTGRADAMPLAVNDEPAQHALTPARKVVVEMEALRRQAHQASNDASGATLEQVLADMQKLRAKVQWHALVQERQRRQAEGLAAIRRNFN